MAKVHSDSKIGLRVQFSGHAAGGIPFAALPRSGDEIEAALLRHAEDFEMLVRRHVKPHAIGDYFIAQTIEREFTCSGCGAAWTEKSSTYNGGCCAADEANNPEATEPLEMADDAS